MASVENIEAKEGREPIRNLTYPLIFDQALELAAIEEVSDWRRELINYLENGTLPSKRKSVIQLRMKAERFTMVNGTLYKKGFTLPS
jgi:hypothetical protein